MDGERKVAISGELEERRCRETEIVRLREIYREWRKKEINI